MGFMAVEHGDQELGRHLDAKDMVTHKCLTSSAGPHEWSMYKEAMQKEDRHTKRQ